MEETIKEEITIRLFGSLGGEINGDEFARDLATLEGKAKKINLHINSPGGSVSQGYSIISVMLSSKTPIDVYIVGIAASMAAAIAVCGRKVFMYDYSKLMIHDPFYSGKSTAKLSDKDRRALDQVTDSLRTILSRRGKDKTEIAKLMQSETWFGADEARRAGLADGIISTKREDEFKNLSANDIFSRISAEYFHNNNNSTFKNMDLSQQLAAVLGLDDPEEKDVIAAVKRLVSKNKLLEMQSRASEGVKEKLDKALSLGIIDEDSYGNLLSMGTSAPEAFEEFIEKKTEEYEAAFEMKVNDYFQKIKAKLYYVKFQDKQELKEMARKNFDMFVRLTSLLPDRRPLSEELESMVNKSGRAGWTLDDYRKERPEQLRNNPALYEKLIEQEKRRNNSR